MARRDTNLRSFFALRVEEGAMSDRLLFSVGGISMALAVAVVVMLSRM
jgi:hypothetical protein